MSFTTIRYSSVPENNHSFTSDTTAYAGRAGESEAVVGFLPDGSPDPMVPGAYRYRARPDLCDPSAPESDPANPHYEPPHLRHRPGDTWIIDRDRPYDPDDLGPYGSPDWKPDPRTGRHRRSELPDPLPPEEREAVPEPEAADAEPSPPRRRPPTAGSTGGPAAESVPSGRPSPGPRHPGRFWPGTDHAGMGPDPDESHRFSSMREAAFDRFMHGSEAFARAHDSEMEPGRWERAWTKTTGWCKDLIRPAIRRRAPEAPAPQMNQPTPQRQRPTPQIPQQRPRQDRPRPCPVPTWNGRAASHQARTARFATALRGARRARSEPPQAPSFIDAWEHAFDAGHRFGIGTHYFGRATA
ncbi:hypothetical protein [Glycomyces buryatensis]|uniref:Uncharacterized protein n=1 Tax=Glycomyces buryatensis TaxID=2570927 RepID=A0A4S8Q8M5_9ACTN|nr:hypothetical protein [Glycomyces buryatensis]THV40530.1 hypothetical protein FAB82_14770 [Glycomyces buryatensis]